VKIDSIGNPRCHLAECPLWNETEGGLYWTDILEKRIWKYQPDENSIQMEWEGDLMVGGFAFTADNDMVLCTHKGIYHLSRTSGSENRSALTLLFDIPLSADERFNDITTDPKGRILAGTLNKRRRDGILYRLEKGKEPAAILHDIGTSNGMTFSLDLRYFYHTDSHARTITRYDYDLDTGDICDPQIIYQGLEANGAPDGITLDLEDHIWVACWGGSKVIRIDPEGQMLQQIPVPARQPSSVVFGDAKMDALYITSACEGCVDLDKGIDAQGRYLGGEVYRIHPGVRGRKEWRANF